MNKKERIRINIKKKTELSTTQQMKKFALGGASFVITSPEVIQVNASSLSAIGQSLSGETIP